MATFCKAIKPQRLKLDAFRLELLNAMRKAGRTIIREDFEPTTATWEHEVTFDMAVSLKQPGPTVTITTQDDVWNMLDKGTQPHEIWAGAYTGKSKAKVLAFPSAFSPKTRPRQLKSYSGRRGGETVFRPYVEHPGTEAREWTKTAASKRRKWYKSQMQAAMRRAVKKSGHAL